MGNSFVIFLLSLCCSPKKDGLREGSPRFKKNYSKAHHALKERTDSIDGDRRSEQSVISEHEQKWMEGLKQDWICF